MAASESDLSNAGDDSVGVAPMFSEMSSPLQKGSIDTTRTTRTSRASASTFAYRNSGGRSGTRFASHVSVLSSSHRVSVFGDTGRRHSEVARPTIQNAAARQEEINYDRRDRLQEYLNDLNGLLKKSISKTTTHLGMGFAAAEDCSESESVSRGVRLVNSRCFQTLSFFAVFMSSTLVALQLDMPEHRETWYAIDLWCVLIFSLEVLVRLCALGRMYCKEFWNIFDMVLLLFNIVDILELVQITDVVLLRIMRGSKVFRAFRFWKVLPEIRRVSSAISGSIASMTWGFALLVIVLYMGGILSTVAFRDTSEIYPGFNHGQEEWAAVQDFNPVMYFGSVISAMYTLLNLAIQTEFAEFARAIWIKQPFLFLGIAAFACCTCFGMQNFVITACVERAADVDRRLNDDTICFIESHKLDTLKELIMVLFGNDHSREVLTQKQLVETLHDEEIRYKLEVLEFPVSLSGEELFTLLDDTGTGEIPYADFMRNAVHLIGSSSKPFEGHCLTQLSLNRILSRLHKLESNLGSGSSGGSWPGGMPPGRTDDPEMETTSIGTTASAHVPDRSGSGGCDSAPTTRTEKEKCRLRAQVARELTSGSNSSAVGSGRNGCSSMNLIGTQDAQQPGALGDHVTPAVMNSFQDQLKEIMQRATEEISALGSVASIPEPAHSSCTKDVSDLVPSASVAASPSQQFPVLLGRAGQPSGSELVAEHMDLSKAEENQVGAQKDPSSSSQLAAVVALQSYFSTSEVPGPTVLEQSSAELEPKVFEPEADHARIQSELPMVPMPALQGKKEPRGSSGSAGSNSLPFFPRVAIRRESSLSSLGNLQSASRQPRTRCAGGALAVLDSSGRMTKPQGARQRRATSPKAPRIHTGIGRWFSSISAPPAKRTSRRGHALEENQPGSHSPFGSEVQAPQEKVHL